MNEIGSKPIDAQVDGLTPLPLTVTTKDRQLLSTEGDVWRLRANNDGGGIVDIDYRPIYENATLRCVEILKRFIVFKARTSAAWSLRNVAQAINRAARHWQKKAHSKSDWASVDVARCQSLLSLGMANPQGVGGNDFAHVRALYAWGCNIARLPDFDPMVLLELKSISAPGNLKGQKVLSSDPEEGEFSPEEVELLDNAVKSGLGDKQMLVIVQLFLELGLRPIQLLRARWSGLRRFEANIVEQGEPRSLHRYTLEIPRAKERGEFRIDETRPISTLLGRRLDLLKPSTSGETTPLLWWLPPDASSLDLGHSVQEWAKDVGITSPRTGRALKVNPTRFRYSIATEAARDGASKFDIAHLLFHKDLQNVDVYFDAAGTVMDQIEDRLSQAFEPQLDRFLGGITSVSDPSPHEGLERRVVPGTFPQLPEMPVLSLGLGACGQNVQRDGLCRLAPPITCYRCPKFAAFREANHGMVGDALENMARMKFGGRADDRIGGELILTIQAIRDLERQIAQEHPA